MYEREFDHDLHCYEVIKADQVIATIYPDTIEEMDANIH